MKKSPRIFYLIDRLSSSVRLRVERALREFDLTAKQYTIMSRIRAREILSAATLARHHHVSPQTMYELVGNLEARGLLSRSEDPENRRVLLVSLTDAGNELLTICDRKVDELEKEFFESLDSVDFGMLYKLLDVVTKDVHRDSKVSESI